MKSQIVKDNTKPTTPPASNEKEEFTLTVYVENQPGILHRVSLIFSRRKINITSLVGSPTEEPTVHRLTIVIREHEDVVKRLCRALEKQIEVLRAFYSRENEIVWQELALFKVKAEAITERIRVERLLRKYGATAVVIRKDFIIFEATGQHEEIDGIIKVLEPLGLTEFVRSGRVAILKGVNYIHDRLKNFNTKDPGEKLNENEFLDENEQVFSM